MLTSPGWRGRPRQCWILLAFVLGLVCGGVSTALVLWVGSRLVMGLPLPHAATVLGLLCIAALLRDTGRIDFPLPENRRLVPQDIFRKHPLLAGGQFGFELGTGVRTYVPTSSPYLVASAVLLLAPPLVAAISAGVAFGCGRAAMVVARKSAADVMVWDEQLSKWTTVLQRASVPLVTVGIGVLFFNLAQPDTQGTSRGSGYVSVLNATVQDSTSKCASCHTAGWARGACRPRTADSSKVGTGRRGRR